MAIPNPVRLFHITAIANLKAISNTGALVSNNLGKLAGINYQNIAHRGAQGARAIRQVPNPPGGVIHDYVPFYFAPRSPMLSAIENGKVVDCHWRQSDIIHFETTVDRVAQGGKPFVFFDRNATLPYSEAYTSLEHMDQVAWNLFFEPPQLDGYCKYFFDRPSTAKHADRMERRQAEFLVKDHVTLEQFMKIGVIDRNRAAEVRIILDAAGVKLPVEVKPEWYFLGQ